MLCMRLKAIDALQWMGGLFPSLSVAFSRNIHTSPVSFRAMATDAVADVRGITDQQVELLMSMGIILCVRIEWLDSFAIPSQNLTIKHCWILVDTTQRH